MTYKAHMVIIVVRWLLQCKRRRLFESISIYTLECLGSLQAQDHQLQTSL